MPGRRRMVIASGRVIARSRNAGVPPAVLHSGEQSKNRRQDAGVTKSARPSVPGGWGFAAQLVEEVEDEGDLIDRRSFGGSGCFQHGEALAIGMQIEIGGTGQFGELPGRPQPRLVRAERVPGGRVGSNHDGIVRAAIKKLFAVARPRGEVASTGGNLPLTGRTRERRNVNLGGTGFVGAVCEPAAIR